MDNEMLTSELKGHRTLATVVFTDCVGFSARMSVSEEHTLDLIRRDLKLMKQICERFEGRVLKTTGDGLLMCFSSAVKAVECAIAIQKTIAETTATLPPNDSLIHRIGIHLADMYITETDVMGNGVNIAARLQTEADPGGICISQTVYDVAKHGLQLTTEYLGPRDLKNIREVVPAYKVLLEPEAANDIYAEAARNLESRDFSRIRKLMFYICKNRWESDESRLNNLSFKRLLQEFLGLASSYDQLKGLLSVAVGTLSKQAEYTLIANEILQEVAQFYALDGALQSADLLPVVANSPIAGVALIKPQPEQQALYRQIAQGLDYHSDALRLKKLLYYVCRRQWEGDAYRLSQINTAALVQEIHTSAPGATYLKNLVDKLAATLNKQAEYALVALTLVSQLDVLYGGQPLETSTRPEPAPSATVPTPTATATSSINPVAADPNHQTVAASLDQHPHAVRLKKLLVYVCRSQWITDVTQLSGFDTAALLQELQALAPSIERLQQALNAVVQSLSKQAEYAAIATLLIQKLRRLYETPVVEPPALSDATANATILNTVAGAKPEMASDRPAADNSASVSLFDARLGIQKYTNPLKAKILTFSALHSDFAFNEQDWFSLKNYELDHLLRGLLTTCKNFTDLELLLYSTARRLQTPDELIQTADTITKSLRSFYIHGSPMAIASSSADATKISLDDFEESTQGLAEIDEYEHTCQLATAFENGVNSSTSINQSLAAERDS